MAFSLEAGRLGPQRTVCDVCGATSAAERGSRCRTCTTGTMHWHTELQLVRERRKAARREARAQQLLR